MEFPVVGDFIQNIVTNTIWKCLKNDRDGFIFEVVYQGSDDYEKGSQSENDYLWTTFECWKIIRGTEASKVLYGNNLTNKQFCDISKELKEY